LASVRPFTPCHRPSSNVVARRCLDDDSNYWVCWPPHPPGVPGPDYGQGAGTGDTADYLVGLNRGHANQPRLSAPEIYVRTAGVNTALEYRAAARVCTKATGAYLWSASTAGCPKLQVARAERDQPKLLPRLTRPGSSEAVALVAVVLAVMPRWSSPAVLPPPGQAGGTQRSRIGRQFGGLPPGWTGKTKSASWRRPSTR